MWDAASVVLLKTLGQRPQRRADRRETKAQPQRGVRQVAAHGLERGHKPPTAKQMKQLTHPRGSFH
jgi:hypothetical protein